MKIVYQCELCDKVFASEQEAILHENQCKGKRFRQPTVEECENYFRSNNCTDVEAKKFYAYYSSNGWKVGKNVMKSWHSAASGWILRVQPSKVLKQFEKTGDKYDFGF